MSRRVGQQKPQQKPPQPQMLIRVPQVLYNRLTEIKLTRTTATGRVVTYAEVIEQLLERQP